MPITITLPNSTLDQLARIGKDRAKAIVQAVRNFVGEGAADSSGAKVVAIAPGVGIITVGRSRYLKNMECLRLVEIVPGRFILSVLSGTPPENLEVQLADALEAVSDSEPEERSLLKQLLSILRAARKTRRVTKEEILIIGMECSGRRGGEGASRLVR